MKNSVPTSGVIGSFNQIEFIEEAVVSLVNQVDELIVVDDQSQDGTYEKLMHLESIYSELRVIKPKTKLGVSGVYNLAAMESNCEILLMQGGDDVSMEHRAKTQIAILEDPKISVAYSLPSLINRYSQILPASAAPEFFREWMYDDILAELFYIGNFICAPSVAMRKADYLKLGGFPINVDAYQDYGLWLTAADIGNFKSSEAPIVNYRKHSRNLSKLDFSQSAVNRRKIVEFEFVIDSVLPSISSDGLRGLLIAVGIYEFFDSPRLNEALVKSKHPNKHVQLSAIQDLLHESQNKDLAADDLQTCSELINQILATVDPNNITFMQQAIDKFNAS